MKLPTFGLNKLIPDATATSSMVRDEAILSAKKETMGKLRWNSLLQSASAVGALIAGPLIATGITAAAMTLAGITTPLTAGAVGTFAAIGGLPVVAMIAAGALFAGISVAASYTASRIWQSKQFDNFEIGAISTAHHIAQELKGLASENPSRADGKSWVQYTKETRSAQQQARS